MSSDTVVVSFHDSLLRQSDVSLLKPGCWLNDRLIGFAFEYFEREQFQSHHKQVCFISPDVTQFIKLASGAELDIFLEPLGLNDKEFVFLAVNDNSSTQSAGGSHWSLLFYHRAHNGIFHYDSYGGYNSSAAKAIANKVRPYLKASADVDLVEKECPQQTNGSDCGVYVISIAEWLCKQHLLEDTGSLEDTITASYVSHQRETLASLIHQLAAQPQFQS